MALDAHGPCEYNAPLFAGAGGLQGVRTAQHDIWGLRVPCKFNSRALPASRAECEAIDRVFGIFGQLN